MFPFWEYSEYRNVPVWNENLKLGRNVKVDCRKLPLANISGKTFICIKIGQMINLSDIPCKRRSWPRSAIRFIGFIRWACFAPCPIGQRLYVRFCLGLYRPRCLACPSLGDVIIVQWVTRCEWQGYYSLVNPSYSWRWVKRLKCFRLKQFLDIYKAWLSPATSGELETSAELRK